MRALIYMTAGAATALALMLSCSDDSPGDADAAENCEPPLAGRINRVENVRTAQTGALINSTASCPAGQTLLGGGCEVEGQNYTTLILNVAGSSSATNAYGCQWQNPSSITVETVRAWAICLTPAP